MCTRPPEDFLNFKHLTRVAAALVATALPGAALADAPAKLEAPKQEYVIDPTQSNDERREGVDWQLSPGATFTFNNNQSVVGQVDGSTLIFGFKLDGIVNYNHAEHEWRNTLALGEGLARTPLVAYNELPPDDERSALELTNLSLLGTLSFKLVEWASVDYELRAIRQPQLLDKFQVQNNLLLTFGFSTGNLPPKK